MPDDKLTLPNLTVDANNAIVYTDSTGRVWTIATMSDFFRDNRGLARRSAHLFAAAPDMVDALTSVYEWFAELQANGNEALAVMPKPVLRSLCCVSTQIDAALVKARGDRQ